MLGTNRGKTPKKDGVIRTEDAHTVDTNPLIAEHLSKVKVIRNRPLRKTRLFLSALNSLCLSRACLGKMIVFSIIEKAQKMRFSHHQPSGAIARPRRPCRGRRALPGELAFLTAVGIRTGDASGLRAPAPERHVNLYAQPRQRAVSAFIIKTILAKRRKRCVRWFNSIPAASALMLSRLARACVWRLDLKTIWRQCAPCRVVRTSVPVGTPRS